MLTQNQPSAGIFGWLQKGQKYELEGEGESGLATQHQPWQKP